MFPIADWPVVCILGLNEQYDHNVTISQTIMASLGWGATQSAQANTFSRYQRGKSTNTLKTQYRALQLWAQFLNASAEKQGHVAAFSAEQFFADPEGWGNTTWGLVAEFYDWLLAQGFALSTSAHRLAHVKQYARLAAQACTLDRLEAQMIQSVVPYSRQEARHVDAARDKSRIGFKKSEPTQIPAHVLQQLRNFLLSSDSERDRRDLVLLGLLADHGLRVGEIHGLTWQEIDLEAREISLFRPKTGTSTRQHLTRGLHDALILYRQIYPLSQVDGALIVASESMKPVLVGRAMSYAGLQTRARRLGQLMGIKSVSAHDFRHHAATEMARQGRPITELRDWFGWTRESTMPMRYIAMAEVARRGDLEAA